MKKLFLFPFVFLAFGCACHKKPHYGAAYTYSTKGGIITEDSFRRQQMNSAAGLLDTASVLAGFSISTADTVYITWLGPDSVMCISGHGIFTDTTIISNPKHQYKK